MIYRYFFLAVAAALTSFSSVWTTAADQDPVHADAGKTLYRQYCMACHGEDRQGGDFAPPLAGVPFFGKWGGQNVAALLDIMEQTMPPGTQGILDETQYRNILAYLLQDSGLLTVAQATSESRQFLSEITIPMLKEEAKPVEIMVPPPPEPLPNPLDTISPVTDNMLRHPPSEDWLMWRQGYDAQGYSALNQITDRNVNKLQVSWAWTLPHGRNITTPLVHDGVLFAYGFGDRLYAFNAKTGDMLWQYRRKQWSGPGTRIGLRSIALYKNKVIFSTDAGEIVALDMKTGTEIWEKALGIRFSGGPLVADGKIIIGTSTGASTRGHNFVVALDADTGDEQWRFYTVARPDEPGGDSWNNIDAALRTGAGIWIPGSYDAKNGLVFFGTGNNYYNDDQLRHPSFGSGSNDQLYTNSTLALDVHTGRLVWYFQHLPNDQWNYDWAFERTLVTVPLKDKTQQLVVTGGKSGIFDFLRVKDGSYHSSVDLGLQNVVASIDPQTGARQIAADKKPVHGKNTLVCPSFSGVRNWMPTAVNAKLNSLFVPFNEDCMDMHDPAVGDHHSFGGFGVKVSPRPDSDGRFGGVRALDLATGETLWMDRRRAIPRSGLLATAGNLVFAGFHDRKLIAYQAKTGKRLWQARLSDVPSASPVTYMVDGKQYIAVITGSSWSSLASEIKNPEETNATLWVFALPESNK